MTSKALSIFDLGISYQFYQQQSQLLVPIFCLDQFLLLA